MSSAPWGCIGCTDAFFVPFRFGRSHLRAVEGGDGWYLPVPLSWLRIAKSIYVIHITLVNGMMDRKQSPRDFVEKKKPMIKEDGSADCSVFDRHRFGCASLALRPFFFNRTCLAMRAHRLTVTKLDVCLASGYLLCIRSYNIGLFDHRHSADSVWNGHHQ